MLPTGFFTGSHAGFDVGWIWGEWNHLNELWSDIPTSGDSDCLCDFHTQFLLYLNFPWTTKPTAGMWASWVYPKQDRKGGPQAFLHFLNATEAVLLGELNTGFGGNHHNPCPVAQTQSSLNYFGWKWPTKATQEWWQFWATGIPFSPEGPSRKSWFLFESMKYFKHRKVQKII